MKYLILSVSILFLFSGCTETVYIEPEYPTMIMYDINYTDTPLEYEVYYENV